ncbi:hypothetical protein GCM10014713_65550 [Streptomyces purpureus]|uniref:Uncharacterized protein n=1 Tax=Streptomyces purpureus TaxID=1951 RepID=A0A918HH90_9ACTN|nr:hypothetical protein GCM10014713_65550 [Streptomyces purpureus]
MNITVSVTAGDAPGARAVSRTARAVSHTPPCGVTYYRGWATSYRGCAGRTALGQGPAVGRARHSRG